jgi:hypothetical protein
VPANVTLKYWNIKINMVIIVLMVSTLVCGTNSFGSNPNSHPF